MSRTPNHPVAISLRLYRVLARAFPQEFKNAYGDEVVQVAEDSVELIWRRYGVLGLMRLLVDIAIRVPAEHLSELWKDIRYGLRMLAASPGFTAVALISLSLGICVPSAVFSELNATMFRNVPGVERPGELVSHGTASFPAYKRYREGTDIFASTLAYVAPVPFGVSRGGRTERTWGHLVTPSYFSTLGVRPALGRLIGEEHEQPGGAPVVVVSHRFWKNQLGSDPSAIGRTLRINGHPSVLIGVAPEDFLGASPMMFVADLWMPLSVGPQVAPELAGNALERRDIGLFHVVGRLKPGVSADRAEAEMDAVARQFRKDNGEPDQKGRLLTLVTAGRLLPVRKQDIRGALVFFGVLSGLIVLIACSNVANMMLARAAGRRREIAVRLALGASRARLVRQLLTESMLIAAGAAILGFALTWWLMYLMTYKMDLPHVWPVVFYVQPDGRVLAFTVVLAGVAGLAFGLVPALQATRTDLASALKEGGNVRLRKFRRLSLRNLLMVHQVAASIMVLLLTWFVVLGFFRSTGSGIGFNASNLSLVSLDPVRDGYSGPRAAAFLERLLDRAKALPSVLAATLTETVPVTPVTSVRFSTAGAGDAKSPMVLSAMKCVVGRDYFETIGIPILAGRGFHKQDEAETAPGIIVNAAFVNAFWKGADPLGRRIEITGRESGVFNLFFGSSLDVRGERAGRLTVFEVVGVAKDVRVGVALERPKPAIYFPLRPSDYAQPSPRGVTLMLRAVPGADAIAAVRREIAAMDPALTTFNARGLQQQIDQSMIAVNVGVWSYGCMGGFGLALAAVGLAGVTAYAVVQRRREIAIRVAVGARSRDVLRLVMREGAVLMALGTSIGFAGAWAGRVLLASMLADLERTMRTSSGDPVLLIGGPLLLVSVALAGCYIPARKSTRIDPVVALRQE